MTKFATIALGLFALTGAPAFAHTPSHSDIEAREQRQLGQIEDGRQTGTITWTEGLRLRVEQRRIKALEEAYEADGHVSRSERSNLNALQNNARAHIVQEQHDGWHRPWWLPRFGR